MGIIKTNKFLKESEYYCKNTNDKRPIRPNNTTKNMKIELHEINHIELKLTGYARNGNPGRY